MPLFAMETEKWKVYKSGAFFFIYLSLYCCRLNAQYLFYIVCCEAFLGWMKKKKKHIWKQGKISTWQYNSLIKTYISGFNRKGRKSPFCLNVGCKFNPKSSRWWSLTLITILIMQLVKRVVRISQYVEHGMVDGDLKPT